MGRIAEGQDDPMSVITQTFEDLLGSTEQIDDESTRLKYINRHLDFLAEEGFISGANPWPH